MVTAWCRGTVGVQKWLNQQGVNRYLAEYYRQTGWLKRLGYGAYQLVNDTVDWRGVVYTLQNQLNYRAHVSGQTTLELPGYYQHVRITGWPPIWLSKPPCEIRKLPP